MFQFPPFALYHCRVTAIWLTGCPIRKSAGQRIFAPYRGLSQLITSFIASVSQGIRHAPLLTLFLVDTNLMTLCMIHSETCQCCSYFSCFDSCLEIVLYLAIEFSFH